MRRGRCPAVFKIIIDHVQELYPSKNDATVIERMLRAREVTFSKKELKKIIPLLWETYSGLGPKKKKELPEDLSALRKMFQQMVDKAEREPAVIIATYNSNHPMEEEKGGEEEDALVEAEARKAASSVRTSPHPDPNPNPEPDPNLNPEPDPNPNPNTNTNTNPNTNTR